MVTDDPGTPGDGHWEINIVGLLTRGDQSHQSLIEAPYFDINYGWGDHVQLKLETGWVTSAGSQGGPSGGDITLAGVKYRFLDEESAGVSVSTYPQFQYHSFYTNNDPDLTPPGNQLFLPVEFSKTWGAWAINPEVGYLYSTAPNDPRQLVSGVVVAYENAKPWEPLFELHANTNLDGSGTRILVNLGFRCAIDPKANLIAALGHTVTYASDQENELSAYLGVQLEL